MKGSLFHQICFWFVYVVCRLFFRRIRMMGVPLPRGGRPVIYVGALDNGALDEWVFSFALRSFPTFISPATFENDPPAFYEVASERYVAPQEAIDLLQNGGALFLNMPSNLEHPELLVEAVASAVIQRRTDVLIVPIALFYESPNSWGSAVEIVAGEPLSPAFVGTSENLASLIVSELLIVKSKEIVSSPTFEQARQLAFLASCEDDVSYSLALRAALRLPLHSPVMDAWRSFCGFFGRGGFCLKLCGVPLFPSKSAGREAAEFCLSLPPLLLALLLNAPAALAAWGPRLWQRNAGENVAAKQAAAGTIVLFFWTLPFWAYCWNAEMPALIPLHLLLTATAVHWAHIFKSSAVKLYNALRYPHLKEVQERVREELLTDIFS